MSSFDERLRKGNKLEHELMLFLNNHSIEYLQSGYEHLRGSKSAHEVIARMSDKTSAFVRYYPDFVVFLPEQSVLIDPKNSTGIERDCYTFYMQLHEELELKVAILAKNKRLYKIEDLRFKQMYSFDRIAGIEVPVVDGIWKVPRNMSKCHYHRYLNAYKNAGKTTSGCSFAFIDFNSRSYDMRVLLGNKNEVTEA